jgi:hypothetical protein
MSQPRTLTGTGGRSPTPTIDKLIKCAGRGLTRLQTAKACRCSYQKVCRLAVKFGVEFRDEVKGAKPKKKDRVTFLLSPFINEAIDSIDYDGVAKAIGCSKQYVYSIVKGMKSKMANR